MIIRIKVSEQTLSIVNTKSVPRKGSKEYLLLQFLFSSDWKDLDKVCYLQKGDVSQPIDVVEGIVEVPEWFTEQDSFDVTLFGTNGGQEVPTNVVALQLEKSNTLWQQDAPEPQPSWLAKIIDLNNHPPIPGDNGYWLLWDTDSGVYVESELPLPAGAGVPDGGTAGQLLSRTESGTEWIDPPQSGVQSDWNQNDSTAPDYVKNRTHYEESTYTDYIINVDGTQITGFSMPEVGETVTVKINSVESSETVKTGTSSPIGNYTYIGTIDFDSLMGGGTGWCVVAVSGVTVGFANPDTTISIVTTVIHKIDDKFINFDGLVRTFGYHFKGYTIYKSLYKNDGSECRLYTCNNFILPEIKSQLFGFMSEIGFSKVGSVGAHSCFVRGFIISGLDGSVTVKVVVLGTNTTEMEELAANNGYTLTTNPNA